MFLQEVGYPTVENPSVTPFTVMLLIISTCLVPTMIVHIYRVVQKRLEQKQELSDPLLNLFPFFIIFFSAFYYVMYSSIGFKVYPVVTVSRYIL